MTVRRPIILAGTGLLLVLLWGELENWRFSWRHVGFAAGSSEAVVVLGFRNPGERANALNRWRVKAALRSVDPGVARSCLLCSGGPAAGVTSEAAVMARFARESCGFRGEIRLEETSRSTWENVQCVVPLIEEYDRIKIVSDPLHAEHARRYLLRLRPDLAARLVRGSEYRFGEWMFLKPVFAAYGRWTFRS